VDDLQADVRSDGAVSIGRREMLRRGAALGAAMAVASPAVQALGRASAFASTSPAPPPPPPPPEPPPPEPEPALVYPSHFQIVVGCGFASGRARVGSGNTSNIGVKWDEGDGGWGRIGGGNTCSFNTTWRDPTNAELATIAENTSVAKGSVGDGVNGKYVLTFTGVCGFITGHVFDGTCQISPGHEDKCGPEVKIEDGVYTFEKC
jgi:hypothetical protein